VDVNSGIVASLSRFQPRINSFREKIPDAVVVTENSGFRELLTNALKFDIGALLRPKTFVYLLVGTVMFLFQTYNTLTIINLAQQNDKLREQIHMSSSVITSQELRVHELHSIHNIAQDAASLGLAASNVPAVELGL